MAIQHPFLALAQQCGASGRELLAGRDWQPPDCARAGWLVPGGSAR